SRGCQGPLDVGSGSGQALRSGRVLRSFLRCVSTASEEVRHAIGLGHGVDLRSTGRSLTGPANAATVAPVFHMVIAPRAREASVQISPLPPYGLTTLTRISCSRRANISAGRHVFAQAKPRRD